MADITYTDPDKVTDTRVTDVPVSGHTVSGYGGKIPTGHMIRYDGVWRRVYTMVYSNSGTAYVLVRGERRVLDTDTEHKLREQ